MAKILLSTYTISLRPKKKKDEYYILNNINGLDFYNIIKDFIEAIERNPITLLHSVEKKTKISLTLRLGDEYHPLSTQRIFYGRFESGASGRKGTISDIHANEDVFSMQENHARMHPLFFYISIPKGSKKAYLILQRESNFGIKKLFEKSLRYYLNNSGYDEFLPEVDNFLLPSAIQALLEHGKVNSVTLFRKEIPHEIDDLMDNNWKKDEYTLKTKTVITDKHGVPIKGLLEKIFYRNFKDKELELNGSTEQYEDISFTLSGDDKQKTYYMNRQSRSLPDWDVTDKIKWDGYMPSVDSLKQLAEDEIKEMVELVNRNRHVATEN
ncbi:hypothetical protein BZG01_04275 [Labilibaculum manganireducens]|uniref:DUF4747 domain-containing protein n=1 Tax=Labilibaculum manganireducens TaxID=1940525 RepID=A0A2N3IDQ1_9BACT|nr:hypothetical protein [Labilibaculum manganireducens]PKQ68437.1 hypothetical protein BZG01_04275 [Labilibaculum manganireducens]